MLLPKNDLGGFFGPQKPQHLSGFCRKKTKCAACSGIFSKTVSWLLYFRCAPADFSDLLFSGEEATRPGRVTQEAWSLLICLLVSLCQMARVAGTARAAKATVFLLREQAAAVITSRISASSWRVLHRQTSKTASR